MSWNCYYTQSVRMYSTRCVSSVISVAAWGPSLTAGGVMALRHRCASSLAFMLRVTMVPCTVAMATASSFTCVCDMYSMLRKNHFEEKYCACQLRSICGCGRDRSIVIKHNSSHAHSSSSPTPSCLHCTKRPVSFHMRHLACSASLLLHIQSTLHPL